MGKEAGVGGVVHIVVHRHILVSRQTDGHIARHGGFVEGPGRLLGAQGDGAAAGSARGVKVLSALIAEDVVLAILFGSLEFPFRTGVALSVQGAVLVGKASRTVGTLVGELHHSTVGNGVFVHTVHIVVHPVTSVDISAGIQHFRVARQTRLEVVPVLAALCAPSRFCHADESGEGKVFEVFVGRYVFRPERSLHTDVMLCIRRRNIVRHGHVVVASLHGVVAVSCTGRFAVVVALPAVDVVSSRAAVVFGDDGVESQFCSLGGTALAGVPAHDGGSGLLHELQVGTTGGDTLVPAEEAFALRAHVVRNLLDEVRLQGAVAGETQFLHLLLAEGIAFPLRCGALVAADMDVGVGEDVAELAEDVLCEFHCLGVGHIEDVRRDAAVNPNRGRIGRCAAVFGICGHGGYKMSRHVHLGEHVDVAFGSIGHHLAHFVLGVEIGAVGLAGIGAFARPPIVVDHIDVRVPTVGTCGPHGGKFGVLLDFGTPSLVVGQVPVEDVHLVDGHDVEHLLDFLHAEEVPADVEHKAAVCKAGVVGYGGHGKEILRPFGSRDAQGHIGGEHLADAEQTIIETLAGEGCERNAVFLHHKAVSFVADIRGHAGILCNFEECLVGLVDKAYAIARHTGVEDVDEALCLLHHAVAKCGVHAHAERGGQGAASVVGEEVFRTWCKVYEFFFRLCGQQSKHGCQQA